MTRFSRLNIGQTFIMARHPKDSVCKPVYIAYPELSYRKDDGRQDFMNAVVVETGEKAFIDGDSEVIAIEVSVVA